MGTTENAVYESLQAVMLPGDLPRLLWWVGVVRPEALGAIEGLGQRLADAMAYDVAIDEPLAAWIEALDMARSAAAAQGADLGRPPIWAHWVLFTRPGQPESALSGLLRERIGYPSDEQAGFVDGVGCAASAPGRPIEATDPLASPGPCATCGARTWWRPERSALAICAGCFPPPAGAELVQVPGSEAAPSLDAGRSA